MCCLGKAHVNRVNEANLGTKEPLIADITRIWSPRLRLCTSPLLNVFCRFFVMLIELLTCQRTQTSKKHIFDIHATYNIRKSSYANVFEK